VGLELRLIIVKGKEVVVWDRKYAFAWKQLDGLNIVGSEDEEGSLE